LPLQDWVMESPSTPNRPYMFSTTAAARLELLPALPVQSYRFAAQVRHDSVIRDERGREMPGETGIYFSYVSRDGECSFCELYFADLGRLPPPPPHVAARGNGQVRMRIRHLTEQPDPAIDEAQLIEISQVCMPFFTERNKWRTLSVEVRPEIIRAFWGAANEEVLIGEITLQELMKEDGDKLRGNISRSFRGFEYTPRGGLGIFAPSGTASFRQVVVTPLN
jgi:hypothetical protein